MLLSDFPQEVIEQFTEFLSFKDKKACSLVCKSWKGVFQDSLYSDLVINRHLLDDLVNPPQDNQPPCLKTRLLVRYLELNCYTLAKDEELYILQHTFPNLRYIYFHQNSIIPDNFGVTTNWNDWRSLSEIRIEFDQIRVPDFKNKLVKMLLCLPLLRRLEILNEYKNTTPVSFSLDDFEAIHSYLNHLGYLKLSLNLLTLSETDIERMKKVSPATNIGSLNITSGNTDHRWLCYFARKYPNLHTIELCTSSILPESDEERSDTIALFQQVPLPFQHLTKLNLENRNFIEKTHILFWDIIHFHNMPLKYVSIDINMPYHITSSDNTREIPKHVTEVYLGGFSNTIESFSLKCLNTYSTPIDLADIKYSLCNLVKLTIETVTLFEIDTLLCAAPRLKSLELKNTDVKVKDELYNSQRFELQSFIVDDSKITSDVLRFLSFHCRSLSVLHFKYSSVYGNFTTPGCQFIDMTYARLEKLSLEWVSFIIRDNNKCPDYKNITVITRPVEDITPNQDYDPNFLPVVVGGPSVKAYYKGFYDYGSLCMWTLSKKQTSRIQKFVSNYEENKIITFKRARDQKRKKPYKSWDNSCVFGYTKINLGYVVEAVF